MVVSKTAQAKKNTDHRCVVKVYRAHKSGLRKPVFLTIDADNPATCPRSH